MAKSINSMVLPLRNVAFTIAAVALFASCTNQNTENKAETTASQPETQKMYYTPNPAGFTIQKGINLSHWLSQVFGWSPRAKFITEADIASLNKLGFDHVRLPIDEENLWDENGAVIDSSLNDLKTCIDWCMKHNLRVVVDLHILRSHHFNSRNGEGAMKLWTDTTAQDNFINLWENLSEQLHHYPDSMVAYEPMNEPVAPEHDMWNKLVNRAVAAIRIKEPNRVIIFGSNRWQKPFTYPYLDAPKNDKNIILSFHSYHPYFLTHHKAYWSPAQYYNGPIQYPGQTFTKEDVAQYGDTTKKAFIDRLKEEKAFGVYDKNKLLDIISPAIKKAHELGLQLYCNEFGCLPSVPQDIRLRYFTDVINNFNENGIAYASWDYKGDFGIMGWDRTEYVNTELDTAVVRILTSSAQ